ncbi:MAG: ATP-binding protein [Acetobacter sp.]|nr:ATP-binding protein [Acetobacter sp.]
MNQLDRCLIESVCTNRMDYARQFTRQILCASTTQKDRDFCEEMKKKLDELESKPFQLPGNLSEVLAAQDVSHFREDRFVLREDEEKIVDSMLMANAASVKLKLFDVHYVPALLLTGKPGTGKTLLAKYIAFKLKLPFIYVRFSNLVGSYLGQTQQNIARIFDYVRKEPVVVCFDEIDAIGLSRGQRNDVGEMSRVVIALMQEMDTIQNGCVVTATTNRADMLDAALFRRFTFVHEVELFSLVEAEQLAKKFFASVGVEPPKDLMLSSFNDALEFQPSEVIKRCTTRLVEIIMKEDDDNGR